MAKIKKSVLKNVKNAFKNIKKEEAKNSILKETNVANQLTYNQKRKIRKESFNDHKVKITWNIHPGDLVKIKASASPTGRVIYGLVTWGVKETIQRAPYLGRQKDLSWYDSKIRVMSSAGYYFCVASGMIVIS